SMSASLEATTPLYASLRQPLDPSAIAGTLSIRPTTGRVEQLAAEVSISPLGVTGKIASIIEADSSGANSARPVTYAIWPASSACKTGESEAPGLAIPVDTPVGMFSGADALSRFNAAGGLGLTWNDGTTARLTMTALDTGDGCLRFPARYAALPFPQAAYPVG